MRERIWELVGEWSAGVLAKLGAIPACSDLALVTHLVIHR